MSCGSILLGLCFNCTVGYLVANQTSEDNPCCCLKMDSWAYEPWSERGAEEACVLYDLSKRGPQNPGKECDEHCIRAIDTSDPQET